MSSRNALLVVCAALCHCLAHSAAADEAAVIIEIPQLTQDIALRLAQAALAQCRKDGYQVGVIVVDRGGHPQVVLRDTLAPVLTLEVSRQKAYTAMSFNSPSEAPGGRFSSPFSVGKAKDLLFTAGGLPIHAAGSVVGGVGVAGSPSGETDARCAQAGIDAVREDLEMAGT
jgi:uncharacterized protein GlcG (DUF336 family)